VTGNHIAPVLQAAHIIPVSRHATSVAEHVFSGDVNRTDNGMLLRSDVHTLYDAGYLGVDDKYRLRVSPRLRAEFGNGEEFYSKQGDVIRLPDRRGDRPNTAALEWHMDERFLATA
jgi:putative restriction endonuclease